jgi:hypothetical protein
MGYDYKEFTHKEVCASGEVSEALYPGQELFDYLMACVNNACWDPIGGIGPDGKKGIMFCPDSQGQRGEYAPYLAFDDVENTMKCVCPERSEKSVLPFVLLGVGAVVAVGGVLYRYRENPSVQAAMDCVRSTAAGVGGAVSDGCYAVLRLTGLTASAQEGSAAGSAPLVAPFGSGGFSGLEAGGTAGVSPEALTGTGQPSANPMRPSSYQNDV